METISLRNARKEHFDFLGYTFGLSALPISVNGTWELFHPEENLKPIRRKFAGYSDLQRKGLGLMRESPQYVVEGVVSILLLWLDSASVPGFGTKCL